MRIADYVASAAKALGAHPLRSGLTTLGIAVGVTAVIVMGAVGAGARAQIDRHITSLGTNILVVNTTARLYGGRSSGPGSNLPLSEDDVAAISAKVEGVTAITGQLWASNVVVRGSANTWTRIWGVHPSYLEIRNWPLASGRELNEMDLAGGRRVAVLGQTITNGLFGANDPLGQVIRIRNTTFEVVGTLQAKGKTSTGEDHDDAIFVPISTARRYLVGWRHVIKNEVGQISIKFDDAALLRDAKEDVERVLRQSRRIPPGDDDTFVVGDLTEMLNARVATQAALSWLLGIAATIALLVGGIGIMNIMLVSVSERTREIGLRMALGARQSQIQGQFLAEAVALCVCGGLIGVLFGLMAANATATIAGWSLVISYPSIVLAMASAAGTGILFGYLPARRAGRLNPIDALRSE
jgi:putative ABC transport system permease protein